MKYFLCFATVNQLLDKRLFLTHRLQTSSTIMLIFRPAFSAASGARISPRQNAGQTRTVLLLTAYRYDVIKFPSRLDELGTICNE